MNVEKTEQSATKPCVSCKSFYGNEASDWLCSVCYKYALVDAGIKTDRPLVRTLRRKRNPRSSWPYHPPSPPSPNLSKYSLFLFRPINPNASHVKRRWGCWASSVSASWSSATYIGCPRTTLAALIGARPARRSLRRST